MASDATITCIEGGRRRPCGDISTLSHKRMAMQLAVQLPDNYNDAKRVIEDLNELVEIYLHAK